MQLICNKFLDLSKKILDKYKEGKEQFFLVDNSSSTLKIIYDRTSVEAI